MAEELTPQELEAIIAAQKPGYVLDESAEDELEGLDMADETPAVQSRAADLEYLTKKFLKGRTASVASARDTSRTTQSSKIVRVRPAGVPATDESAAGKGKVVVISAKDKKIVGEQG